MARPRYANKRAGMRGNLGDWLNGGGALPDDLEPRADLTGVEYGYTPRARSSSRRRRT